LNEYSNSLLTFNYLIMLNCTNEKKDARKGVKIVSLANTMILDNFHRGLGMQCLREGFTQSYHSASIEYNSMIELFDHFLTDIKDPEYTSFLTHNSPYYTRETLMYAYMFPIEIQHESKLLLSPRYGVDLYLTKLDNSLNGTYRTRLVEDYAVQIYLPTIRERQRAFYEVYLSYLSFSNKIQVTDVTDIIESVTCGGYVRDVPRGILHSSTCSCTISTHKMLVGYESSSIWYRYKFYNITDQVCTMVEQSPDLDMVGHLVGQRHNF
jgi:hypothetical protein